VNPQAIASLLVLESLAAVLILILLYFYWSSGALFADLGRAIRTSVRLLPHSYLLAMPYGLIKVVGALGLPLSLMGLPAWRLGWLNDRQGFLVMPVSLLLFAASQSHWLEKYWFVPMTWRTYRVGNRRLRFKLIPSKHLSAFYSRRWYPLSVVDATTGYRYGHVAVMPDGWLAVVRRQGLADPLSSLNARMWTFDSPRAAVEALESPEHYFAKA
jgi:hypothetical protein